MSAAWEERDGTLDGFVGWRLTWPRFDARELRWVYVFERAGRVWVRTAEGSEAEGFASIASAKRFAEQLPLVRPAPEDRQ